MEELILLGTVYAMLDLFVAPIILIIVVNTSPIRKSEKAITIIGRFIVGGLVLLIISLIGSVIFL